MKPKYSMPSFARASILIALLLVVGASVALAQAAARLVGTITAINGNTLTVKTDAGEEKQVTVPAETAIKRLEPGQSLSQAATIALSDLAVNDRVLMKLDTSATPPQATMIVAMKHSDVAQRQEKEREAWQQGIAGLVKKVDPAANTILVATGAGPTARNVTVHLTQSTQLLRYSPQSVNFADARPGPLDAIKPGDQLRARGALNADKTEIAADAIVSGTFRNVSGLITQVDPTNGAITVKDLATKKAGHRTCAGRRADAAHSGTHGADACHAAEGRRAGARRQRPGAEAQSRRRFSRRAVLHRAESRRRGRRHAAHAEFCSGHQAYRSAEG